MSAEKRIAKITEAHLEREDHGIFTCWLTLSYGDSFQGAGMYGLDEWDQAQDRRVGTAEGMEFIIRLLEAAGVSSWDKLVGRTVYATADHAKVYAIEPLPTEPGKPFVFADCFRQPRSSSQTIPGGEE